MRSIAPKFVRVGLVGAVFGFALLSSEAARADHLFPPLLAKKLQMPCVPTCIVCHPSPNEGGWGQFREVITNGQKSSGFGKRLRSDCQLDPLQATSSLGPAIDCLARMSPASDLDFDGVPDLEELANGQDPNAAGDAPLCGGDQPEYGCAPARVARRGSVDDVGAALAAVVAVVGLAVFRPARRRPRRCRSH
jgi:hypothetical protein